MQLQLHHHHRPQRRLSAIPTFFRCRKNLVSLGGFLVLLLVVLQFPLRPRTSAAPASQRQARPTRPSKPTRFNFHLFNGGRKDDTFLDPPELSLDWGDGDKGTYAAKVDVPAVSAPQGVIRQAYNALKAEFDEPWTGSKFNAKEGHAASNRMSPESTPPGRSLNPFRSKGTQPRTHAYRADGLMEVNPEAPHPVFDLIRKSEKRWQDRLRKASKTLEEAVREYKRRYQRMPPKGFEHWWNYIVKHNVQLPDEYDQIYHDIEPFWGMKPAYVREQQAAWEADREVGSYTIVNEDHIVYLGGNTMPKNEENVANDRANAMMALLREVQEWLPDFRATLNAHDAPYQFVGYEMKSEAADSASISEYFDSGIEYETSHRGWSYACPATSQLAAFNYTSQADRSAIWTKPKTFIWDQKLSMDPCQHPSHVVLNGFLNSHEIGPIPRKTMVPAFSMCTTQLHADILTVAPEMWTENVGLDPSWKQKKHDTLLWRGRNTGAVFNADGLWNTSQRVRLVKLANEKNGHTSVLPVTRGPNDPVGEPLDVSKGPLNEALFDIGFSGDAIQCTPDICKMVQRDFTYKDQQTFTAANEWKYVLDMDGNGWSARFKRLMTNNSLIFKSTIFPEWYTDRLQAWVHFVPVQNDLTDLYDILTFFRGDHDGKNGHEDLAEKIATQGRKWSLTYWRKEDMVAYMFRLLLEYARMMDYDREAATFQWDDLKVYQDKR